MTVTYTTYTDNPFKMLIGVTVAYKYFFVLSRKILLFWRLKIWLHHSDSAFGDESLVSKKLYGVLAKHQ